jgi:hypothetical protein
MATYPVWRVGGRWEVGHPPRTPIDSRRGLDEWLAAHMHAMFSDLAFANDQDRSDFRAMLDAATD